MIKFISNTKSHLVQKQNQRNKRNEKGFSLPELIIVIAIFVIISSVAMFNQGKLSSSVLLTNMAYEVGLAVREAQTYGIGVRSEDAEGSNFGGQYGVFFDIGTETSKRQVIVFADGVGGASPNYTYETGEEKYIYEFENRRGNQISGLCVGEMVGGVCSNSNVGNTLSVLFKRPNPAALVFAADLDPEPRSDRVYIVVSSLEGDDCRAVIVESTGQIRVEDHTKGACSIGSVTP
jgi:prepilin-type N-terminal cleavage/methylation domain-containing protein